MQKEILEKVCNLDEVRKEKLKRLLEEADKRGILDDITMNKEIDMKDQTPQQPVPDERAIKRQINGIFTRVQSIQNKMCQLRERLEPILGAEEVKNIVAYQENEEGHSEIFDRLLDLELELCRIYDDVDDMIERSEV